MGITERKEREKKRRRQAIIDAAEQVFFSKGIESATMDEVAEMAELSKGTLYLYFNNKNELLHAIVERGLKILYERFNTVVEKEEKGIDKIRALGRAYFEFFLEEPDYYSTMLHHDTHEVDPEILKSNPNFALCIELGNKLFGLMQDAVKTGIKDGSIRRDLDPVKLSLVLWGQSSGVLHLMKSKKFLIEKMFGLAPEELVEYSHDLIRSYLLK
jgi:AcrR family transcriptional regulator